MQKNTILIVEDDVLNFHFLKMFLLKKLKLPCKLVHIENGQLAVEYCEKNTDVNLILMDIKMPVMNGIEATKLIRKIHPNLPIILQTAYTTQEDKMMAKNAGCNDFMSKPINVTVLEDVVNKYLYSD